MKSNLSQILCSVNKNDLLSMVLLQQIKTIVEKFNILITVDFSAREKTFILTPIDKDGEPKDKIGVKMDDDFYTLKTKHRDLYLILLVTKVLNRLNKNIYDHYSYVYHNEDQYVNLLMLALSDSVPSLAPKKDNRDIFDAIIDMDILNITEIRNLNLKIDVQNIDLILSDDLYRYIAYKITDEPCKGLKKPYEEKKLFGYPLKISVDKDSSLDFFTLKINGYEVYSNTILLKMKSAFYLPLHIFEPITYKRYFENSYTNSDLLKKGYTLLDYQGFIQLALKRIFQAIDLINSGEDLVSPLWIRNHYKSLSLPFSKKLLSHNYTTTKCIA